MVEYKIQRTEIAPPTIPRIGWNVQRYWCEELNKYILAIKKGEKNK